MASIAHVTDLHLVEESYRGRGVLERMRLCWLNAGRSIDPARRREHALAALRSARHSDHLLITGDLTEDGVPAQFELLAEVLSEAGLEPERVTLVAGNHDLYVDPLAFTRALEGPLRRYARSSRPGQLLDIGSAFILPIDTAVKKPLTRSSGVFRPEQARQIAHCAADTSLRGRPLVVAQHHPPLGYRNCVWNFIDGLDNVAAFSTLLHAHPRLHVVHGHTHHHGSRALTAERREQIHSSAAIIDDARHVRFYHVGDDELRALDAEPQQPWLASRAARPLAAPVSQGA